MDQQRTQWFSLYHSLQHYKYHTYLMCKDEVGLLHTFSPLDPLVSLQCFLFCFVFCLLVHVQIASLRVQVGELRQEETVQKCLENGAWVEGLFDRFGELINQVQQACQ